MGHSVQDHSMNSARSGAMVCIHTQHDLSPAGHQGICTSRCWWLHCYQGTQDHALHELHYTFSATVRYRL